MRLTTSECGKISGIGRVSLLGGMQTALISTLSYKRWWPDLFVLHSADDG